MATPCDLAWGHLSIDDVIPKLHKDSDAAAWSSASKIRNELLALFETDPPLFALPEVSAAHQLVVRYLREAQLQAVEYKDPSNWRADGRPKNEAKVRMLNAYVGAEGASRPFASVILLPLACL